MKRSEVRTFIEAGVTAVNPSLSFGSGRISEFNSETRDLPATWLKSLEVGTDLNESRSFDSWPIELHIAKKDATDSSSDQYEAIIDECDLIAQKLVKQYNDVLSGSSIITMSGVNRTPFVKKHANCLTGIILSFNLEGMDQTDLC